MTRLLIQNGQLVAMQPGMWITAPAADPFDGLGDFDLHPTAQALLDERARSMRLAEQTATAEVALKNIAAIFDRPLSKLNKKDLTALIRAAQEALP